MQVNPNGKVMASTPRPALLPIDHPLCYPALLKYNSNHNRDELEGTHATDDSQSRTALMQQPSTLEDKITYLYEKDQVIDVLHNYAYTLDSCRVDSSLSSVWAVLFTPNCEVTYPFGTCTGREGLAKFAMKAELRFYRMMHLSSNFKVHFSSPALAFARSTLFAAHATHKLDLGQNFFEGGYYYWTLEKHEDGWKISRLFLDAVWWLGDSLGLNEPHDAAVADIGRDNLEE
ncbi:hypothetical protein GGI43DRAFT_416181 [Trichoderma evansii]